MHQVQFPAATVLGFDLTWGSENVSYVSKIGLEGGITIKAIPRHEVISLMTVYPFFLLQEGFHSSNQIILFLNLRTSLLDSRTLEKPITPLYFGFRENKLSLKVSTKREQKFGS